jgi:ParB/RepB/Spo0J family partition protein
MNVQDILTSKIHAPAEFKREKTREDEQLRASIRASGVEQPLVVLASEGVYKVIKGTRRLAIAKELDIPKLPCVILTLPAGADEMAFMRKERFRIDEHRQDLLPTQRAELVEEIKRAHGFTNPQVATYLGVVPDTIANWTDILKYDKQIQKAVDEGKVKLSALRPLRAIKPEEQLPLFLRHQDEFSNTGATKKLQKRFDHEYSPEKKPELYAKPKVSAAIRSRPKKARRVTKNYSHVEKKKLIDSLEMQEAEQAANRQEIREFREKNAACIPLIAAIIRNKNLWALVPEEMRAELTVWAQKYV